MTESGFSPDTRKRPPIEGKRHTWQKEPPRRDRGASLVARCVRCGATRLTERAKTRNAFGTASVVTYKAHGQAHFGEKRPPCNDGDQANLFTQVNRATVATDDPRTARKESIPDAEFEPVQVEGSDDCGTITDQRRQRPELTTPELAPAPHSEASEVSRYVVIDNGRQPDHVAWSERLAVTTLELSDDAVEWLANEYTWELFVHNDGAYRYREELEVSIRGVDVMAASVLRKVDGYPGAWVVARRLNDGYTRAWKRSPSGWIFYEKGDRREL